MFWSTKRQTPLITPEELAGAIKGGTPPIIVDVRSGKEFQAGHLPGAIHLPLDELPARAAELDVEAPTVFY